MEEDSQPLQATSEMMSQFKEIHLKYHPKNPKYVFLKENKFKKDNDAFSFGMRCWKQGKLRQATLALEAAVQKDPKNSKTWQHLGAAQAEYDNGKKAIPALLMCIDIEPYNLAALLILGVSYTEEIEKTDAVKFLRRWISIHLEMTIGEEDQHNKLKKICLEAAESENHAKDADLYQVLGALYNISGDMEGHIESFKTAVELRPDDHILLCRLGVAQINGGFPGEAVKAYNRALQLRMRYSRVTTNLAIAFAHMDLHEDAVNNYLKTLRQNPEAHHVWDYLKISLLKMGRNDLHKLALEKNMDMIRQHMNKNAKKKNI